MAEHEIHWPYKAGYDIEIEVVRLELYRLLNQFLAESKLSSLTQEDTYLLHAVDIVGHLFTAETQRILTYAAAVARIKDDNENESRFKLANYETTCGELIEDLNNPNSITSLDIREACNKIIHALKFHFDIDKSGTKELINPTVYLYGSKGKKNWRATIEIVEFIKHYINNVC